MATSRWDSLSVGDLLPDDEERSDLAPCEAGSPEGWVCVRVAGHDGRHVAAVDPVRGPAVAVWSEEENFAFPAAASYVPWNLHNPVWNGCRAASKRSGSRATSWSGPTTG